MRQHQHSSNIKVGLFALALIFSSLIFWINRQMVTQLRVDAQKQVEYLAQAYTKAINSTDEHELQFVLDVVLPSLNFPIVITTNKEIYATINLEISYDEGSPEYNEAVWVIVHRMDDEFAPLQIIWEDIEVGDIHFGDPDIVGRMRWLPVMELCLALLFILLSLWGMRLIRKSEKNSIYVGMARETAHQLGTPISSLMGWFRLLQENPKNRDEIMDSIDDDIHRLTAISDRFAKIGSNPKKDDIDICKLIENISLYISHRISDRSKININTKIPDSKWIFGDETLLSWAFENLIKNSVDAIERGEGDIVIELTSISNNEIQIDIIDSGKGIPRKDRSNVFKPGFSSKKRGWGLGLSLTKRIIEELHHGKIFVLKSQPGETVIRAILNLK
ncbi:MAG: HAMP domain-containing histidine kinase [Candidatus Marinimicrobia bacterium]|nr:HAMP domain-containing histidine kinase [Candidatus Neomarinimicrobiota bacterium]